MASGKPRPNEGGAPYPIFGSNGVIGHSSQSLADAGIVVGRVGAYCGSLKLAQRPFWATDNTIVLRPIASVDIRFLFAVLLNANLQSLAGGAAQPLINQGRLKTLRILVPDRATQQRLAAVASAFDELIEINERRIELLGHLTRLLYREWLIRYRFPGHEDVEFVDSEHGPIPEGWAVRRLDELSTVLMGQSPSSEFYNDACIGLPFHQGVSDYGALIPTHRKYCTAENRVAEPMDVLCSVRAPVGRLNIADERLVIGRGLACVRRSDAAQALLFEQLRVSLGEEDSLGGGTIFKAIGRDELRRLPIVEPTAVIADAFEKVARPLLSERMERTGLIRALAATRDLLLPRLVTGRVDMSEIDLGALLPEASDDATRLL